MAREKVEKAKKVAVRPKAKTAAKPSVPAKGRVVKKAGAATLVQKPKIRTAEKSRRDKLEVRGKLKSGAKSKQRKRK